MSTKSKQKPPKPAKPAKSPKASKASKPPKVVGSAERAKNDERDERRLSRAADKAAGPKAAPVVPAERTLTIKVDLAKGKITTDYKGPINVEYAAPKPHPPMRVFVASSGNTSFIITARDAADAREFLGKIRDGVKGMKFRMIDQTLRQVCCLFPIMEVVIDVEGRVDIKKMPAIEQAAEESTDGEAKQVQ
jgi:hypothetical protein